MVWTAHIMYRSNDRGANDTSFSRSTLVKGPAPVDNINSPAVHSVQHPRLTTGPSTLVAVIGMEPIRARARPSISLLATRICKYVWRERYTTAESSLLRLVLIQGNVAKITYPLQADPPSVHCFHEQCRHSHRDGIHRLIRGRRHSMPFRWRLHSLWKSSQGRLCHGQWQPQQGRKWGKRWSSWWLTRLDDLLGHRDFCWWKHYIFI